MRRFGDPTRYQQRMGMIALYMYWSNGDTSSIGGPAIDGPARRCVE